MAALISKIPRSINVLLVEDNPADVVLIAEVFKSSSRPIKVIPVEDGVEAMDYLKCRGGFAGAEKPDLILLDLSMPKKSGFEVLREIRSDPQLTAIPIVILSHSNLDEDLQRAYTERANYYLIKPLNYGDLFTAMRQIEDIWLANIDGTED